MTANGMNIIIEFVIIRSIRYHPNNSPEIDQPIFNIIAAPVSPAAQPAHRP